MTSDVDVLAAIRGATTKVRDARVAVAEAIRAVGAAMADEIIESASTQEES